MALEDYMWDTMKWVCVTKVEGRELFRVQHHCRAGNKPGVDAGIYRMKTGWHIYRDENVPRTAGRFDWGDRPYLLDETTRIAGPFKTLHDAKCAYVVLARLRGDLP